MAAEVLLSRINEREDGKELQKANMLCSTPCPTTLLSRGKMSITHGLTALSWVIAYINYFTILSHHYFTQSGESTSPGKFQYALYT